MKTFVHRRLACLSAATNRRLKACLSAAVFAALLTPACANEAIVNSMPKGATPEQHGLMADPKPMMDTSPASILPEPGQVIKNAEGHAIPGQTAGPSGERAAGLAGNEMEQNNGIKPRTLGDYIEQEKPFIEYLKERHPVFKYQADGRFKGKLTISDRAEEWTEQGYGKKAADDFGQTSSMTYRLAMESILDYPNKFVGPKKCGECHPAQYQAWQRSRHSKVVRFPDEVTEVGGDMKKPLYGSEATVLPMGVEADDVYAIIGTPRTKYGFIDKWLVRGTYHIQGGKLSEGTGIFAAGGNQFSRLWAEALTPEVAAKIAEFAPDFPTKLEDFGPQRSAVWGVNSYGSQYEGKMMFQPASAYCEICHTFKFDFESKEDFLAAIGNKDELRKHTISKGISCEECHGAGAHLYGARGAGMPSNCERCHQRFAYSEADAAADPAKPFNTFFKSACPACGTEGSQLFNTKHYEKGMRCATCHDPHGVTANDWKDPYTKTTLKKTCADCHQEQKKMFEAGGPHAKDNCTGCHMPNMMSCENFASIQRPDVAGFDNVRASHIWKIYVDKDAKTLNPPAGQPRDSSTKGWSIARKDGHFFVDLMWSCARTSWEDIDLVGPNASGCHSAVQSTLPKDLHYTNQAQVFEAVQQWQQPVKEQFKKLEAAIKAIDKAQAHMSNKDAKTKSEIILMTKEARAIYETIKKDGSWGVHGPKYALKLLGEALVYTDRAQELLK